MPTPTRFTFAAVLLGLTAAGAIAADAQVVRGTLVSTDARTAQIVVKTNDGNDMSFTARPDAQFSVAGRPVTISDMKPGQRVRVTYEVADGTPKALTVQTALESDEQLSAAVRNSLDKAKEYTYDRRHEYADELRGVVNHVDDRIDDLENRIRNVDTEPAKRALRRQIVELKVQRDKLSARMGKVKDVGADAWDDLKGGTKAAFEDLGRLFQSDPNDKE